MYIATIASLLYIPRTLSSVGCDTPKKTGIYSYSCQSKQVFLLETWTEIHEALTLYLFQFARRTVTP